MTTSEGTVRVAVLDDYQQVAHRFADWTTLGAGVEVEAFSDHIEDLGELTRRLEPFDVVVAMRERTRLTDEVFAGLPRLRLLVTTGMRNAAIDMAAARERGITVVGTGGYVAPTVELTWGLTLAVQRRIPQEDAAIRAGAWQQTVGVDLAGRTLGVIGLGNIGTAVARIGVAFGMNVVAWSQNLTADRATAAGATLVSRDELLAVSDVVTIHLVLSDRTRGLIGADELASMKRTAILVNTSRGPIVDEAALVEAIHNETIAGAGLDVFDLEPLTADHPLRTLPNTVVTPHVGYVTDGLYAKFYTEIVEDIAAWLAGEPVRVIAAPD